jgi:hypothetical protein
MINYNDLTLKLFFISYYDFIRYLGWKNLMNTC